MLLCTERFNKHLIVCCDCIICFSSCRKSKDAKQDVVFDRDVNFKCGLTEIIKICVRNLGDDFSDKVTCHRRLQIILNSP